MHWLAVNKWICVEHGQMPDTQATWAVLKTEIFRVVNAFTKAPLSKTQGKTLGKGNNNDANTILRNISSSGKKQLADFKRNDHCTIPTRTELRNGY